MFSAKCCQEDDLCAFAIEDLVEADQNVEVPLAKKKTRRKQPHVTFESDPTRAAEPSLLEDPELREVLYDLGVNISPSTTFAKMQSLTLTRDNGRLTLEQRIFYERNGFLIIPRVIPHDILDKCSKRFDGYVDGTVDKGYTTVMRDVTDRKSVNKIQDILNDDVFREYFENDRLLDIVETFVGPNIVGVHSMLIAKPPDAGSGSSRHPPHQDLYYFPFRPADKIVAAWTAIEKCDKENGCLHVFPGSHRSYDLLPHDYPKGAVNKMYHGIQDLPESVKWIDVEMEPGDTVFFHPLLIHGSWTNVSKRTRKAISCHYAAADCYYIEVEGTIQEKIKDEIMAIAERRFKLSGLTFAEVWNLRSSLVRGIRSSL